MGTHTIESWNMSREEYSGQLTAAKNLAINVLYSHGVISDDQAEHYVKDFAIIVSKPSLFNRILGKKDRMIMVEQL